MNPIAIAALVALRFVVGAHFFHEGYTKWRDPKPYSGSFFSAAKGPFAEHFKSHVLDPQGLERLQAERVKKQWTDYVAKAKTELNLSKENATQADERLKLRVAQYEAALDKWSGDIDDYESGLERQQTNATQPWRSYDWYKKHDTRIASDLMPKRMSWQSDIDSIARSLEKDINQLAEGDNDGRWFALDKPGRFFLDSDMLDQIVPWFHMAVGVMLVAGLLTRVSALLAAGFLGSVIASQWPFTPGTVSTSYQQVEFMSLLVLCGVGAGRWAGLDAFLFHCCGNACAMDTPSAQTTNSR